MSTPEHLVRRKAALRAEQRRRRQVVAAGGEAAAATVADRLIAALRLPCAGLPAAVSETEPA